MHDILIKGARVVDPSQGLDSVKDVALAEGKVSCVADRIEPARAADVLDATGLILTPGLIDLHVHVHWGVSHYGVDPDLTCLARGVTTAVDAGSAGAHTYPSLKRFIIDRSQTRLYAFLNIAYQGMIGEEVDELEDLRYANRDLAIEIGRAPEIVGIKARMNRVGENPATAPLRTAIDVAEVLNKPLMIHISTEKGMHVPLGAVLELMRPGDIVTHTYHGKDGGIVDEHDRLKPEVQRARERGILFDVGHGAGSFAFRVARAALAAGFKPDTISSDIHTLSIGGPAFDLPTTMSKFLHLGLGLSQVVERATWAPARILALDDRIGTLKQGAEGDLCLFRLQSGAFPLHDCVGCSETGASLLAPVHVFKGGRLCGMGPRI